MNVLARRDIGPFRLLARVAGVVWLYAFSGWFFSLTLPNARLSDGSSISRWDLWLNLPELLLQNLDSVDGIQSAASGWAYLPQRMDLIAVATFMLIAAGALGNLILRGLRLHHDLAAPEQTVFAFGLGLSGLSLITLGMGCAGLLDRALVVSLLGAIILGEAAVRWLDRRETHGGDDEKLPTIPRRFSAIALSSLVVVTPFLLAMALGAMLPSVDFDVKEYHLQGPKEYFLNGRITFLPHNVYTSFPFLTEMLSLLAMVVRDDWFRGALAGKAVLMMFAPLTAIGLYGAGRRIGSPVAGWIAALLYLTTPWVYRISIIAYSEGGLSFYLLSTLLAVILVADEHAETGLQRGRVLLSGLLAGSAIACKYPGVVSVAIPLGCAVVWVSARTPAAIGRRGAAGARATLLFATGVLMTFGPWMLKNSIETGNPVYPLLYSVFGGDDWDDTLNQRWRAGHSPPSDLLESPAHIIGDIWKQVLDISARSDWQSPLLFAPAALTIFGIGSSRQMRSLWMYVAWLFFSWWGLTHRIDRFWVPMIPVIALMAALAIGWLVGATREQHASQGSRIDRLPSMSLAWGSLLVLLPVGALFAAVLIFNLTYITTRLCGYNAYLVDLDEARNQVTAESIAILQDLPMPAHARVLFVGEAQVFDARFDHVYNTVFDHSIFEQWCSANESPEQLAMRDPLEIRETLREHRITHVLVNWQEILRYRTTYGYTEFVTPERFEWLAQQNVLEPVQVNAERLLRRFDTLSPTEQAELRQWAPQLVLHVDGLDGFVKYSLFTVL